MLQQTQVKTAVPYFEAWMRRFPTLTALAQASEADVLRQWQGLGYYSRARNLRLGAQQVLRDHGAVIPSDPALLRRLPGVGPYTAGAIASIAFGRRAALVDANVSRVLARIFQVAGYVGSPQHDRQIWALAEALVPASKPGAFNQGLMELGALVCKPVAPDCPRCPVKGVCAAWSSRRAEQFGRKAPPKKTVRLQMAAAIVARKDRVLVVQLADSAPRWAGMWQFPCVELDRGERPEFGALRAAAALARLVVTPTKLLPVVRHSVTHHRITLTPVVCACSRAKLVPTGVTDARWMAPDALFTLPMPAAHDRIRRSVRGIS
jgi:A/G-specific adenine glycosylase